MAMKKTVVLALLLMPLLIVSVHAYFLPITWSAYLPISMSSTTTLQGSQPLIFNYYSYGTNSLVFSNIYMGSGSSINLFNVSSIDANLTFNQLSNVGVTSVTAEGNGLTPIILKGFGQAPDSVISTTNQTVPYFYSSSNDTLTLNPTVVVSETILIDYPQNSVNMTMGIAVIALIFGISLGSVALVLALRNSREKEDSHD